MASADVAPGEGEANAFGAELRGFRKAANLSLAELGDMTGFTKGYISKVETGARAPSRELARRCDSALGAAGRLIALTGPRRDSAITSEKLPSTRMRRSLAVVDPVELHPRQHGRIIEKGAAERTLAAFAVSFEQVRRLGQVLPPSVVVSVLQPQWRSLQYFLPQAGSAMTKEALMLSARYAEYAGWMMQEIGDDPAALYYTDQASHLAVRAGDNDMIVNAFVRRANIALYQEDAHGVISFATKAQRVECSNRMKRLAVLREAQGHALMGDEDRFRKCLKKSSQYAAASGGSSNILLRRPVIGSTMVPDIAALATGWGLYDLGRTEDSAQILSDLLACTKRESPRAWARVGARLARALASNRDIVQLQAVLEPVLALFPDLESATIRYDLRHLARTLNRWTKDPVIESLRSKLSAALAPAAGGGAVVESGSERD
ncbi:helix-turn-helix domain-containing protein [Actinokineospora sp. G85]|uniref:helix-turn-helix domain-containing protein n=1 Tax=Actinokineospora sp. G85 TaxID=3406626 RepID=UPI003C71257A